MKWDVFYSAQAKADLRCIYEYIAFSLSEPETAAGQVRAVSIMRIMYGGRDLAKQLSET